MVGKGRPLLPEILGQTAPAGAKSQNRRFWFKPNHECANAILPSLQP